MHMHREFMSEMVLFTHGFIVVKSDVGVLNYPELSIISSPAESLVL